MKNLITLLAILFTGFCFGQSYSVEVYTDALIRDDTLFKFVAKQISDVSSGEIIETTTSRTLNIDDASYGNAINTIRVRNLSTVSIDLDTTNLKKGHYFLVVQDSTGKVQSAVLDDITQTYQETDSEGDLLYIQYLGNNKSWIYGKSTYQPVNALYNNGDAADPTNEGNNANNWASNTGDSGVVAVASVASPTTDGNYALQFTNTNGGAATISLALTVVVGETYQFTFDAAESAFFGEIWTRSNQGWTSNQGVSLTSDSMTSETLTTSAATATTAYLRVGFNASSPIGETLVLDNIVQVQN